jgi:hypothetical protein
MKLRIFTISLSAKEESMFKKLSYGVAFLLVAFVGVGVGVVAATKAKSSSPRPGLSPTGLPLIGGVLKAITLPVLTRDQLVTRGHADDKQEIADLLLTYLWYHDTNNGEGVASVFAKDGTFEHLYNNGKGAIEPNPGPDGRGCLKHGPGEIVKMYSSNPLPFPGHSHDLVTNVLVQVYGDTATVYADFTSVRSDAGLAAAAKSANTTLVTHGGEDVGDLRRTPEGWRFVHLRVIQDALAASASSDPACPVSTQDGE